MNPFAFLLLCVAGWMNRNQQDVVEYLQEEIRVLEELLGKKPRFNDGQRLRLATKGKQLRRKVLQLGGARHPSGMAPEPSGVMSKNLKTFKYRLNSN